MKTKSIIFCLAFAGLMNTCSNAKAQVNVDDSLVLVDLYNSANGKEWLLNYNWLTDKPVKHWYGIKILNKRVTEIALPSNNLKGFIPASIGNLAELSQLYLFDNQLSGNIPPELGNLINLNSILLGNNQLTGNILPELGNLVNLKLLDLYGNKLTGSIPEELIKLTSLESLNLSNNELTGNIPSELTGLSNLEQLNLSGNQFSGTIPAELGGLNNLSSLNLSFNQLTGSIPPELIRKEQQYLTDLYLNNNQLSGTIPVSISYVGNFNEFSSTSINLSNNALRGSIPEEFGNIVGGYYAAVEINLSNNQLNGEIPSSLGNLHSSGGNYHSFWLNFSNNQLSGELPPELGNIYRLEELDLSNNQLRGNIPISYKTMGDLNLAGNLLSGILTDGSGWNVNDLNISNNHFKFADLEETVQEFLAISVKILYAPQANILIHQNNNALSVSAGGTLSNNTYKWFMIGQTDPTIIVGDSVFSPTQSGKYYAAITNAICTQLTLYTDTIDYTTLPVTIINLNTYQQRSIVKVDWTSLTELNVDRYEIQRSSNANGFATLGSLPAKGNGTQQTNYSFNDLQPLHGNNYYRLKAIDKDGKIAYSKTVLVSINDKTITLVYPVPAKNILHVQASSNASFSLINRAGKILLSKNINGNGTIDVSGLAAGIYYLKNNSNGEIKKIVVVRQ